MLETLDEWRPRVDEEIAEVLPREIDREYLEWFFGPESYRYEPESIQRALADPIWELLDRGGKRWRAVMFLILMDGFGEDPDAYLRYAIIPEILHNGTIIVDDVEDEASMRRGEPALHHVYGEDIALNAGNAMYFLPLKIITHDSLDLPDERRLRAYDMLTHELNRTHLGQGMDICWHNEREVRVSEQEYLEMSACKTGCLARIVARLAAILADRPTDVERHLAQYAEDMAVAFQIGDDILDVENTLDQAGDFGKEFGNDIREGKKTLLVIHAVAEAEEAAAERLQSILVATENTDREILEAIDIMQDTGSIEFARCRAEALAATAREHLAAVDLESEPAAKLEEFTQFVVERDV
ncbi:MAG: geranylgeranyl diphosphate synthase type I [Halobacteriales archaeon]|jgi:geranylgeranyl diphosphate synthase type I